MPTISTGLIEITLEQSYGGANIANVYHYWNSLGNEPISFVGIAADFDLAIAQNQTAIQGTALQYLRIVCKTIFGLLPDYELTPTISNGVLAGEAEPSFLASGVKLLGETKETRPGQKRYAGLTESVVIGNDLTAAFQTALTSFAANILTTVDDGVNTFVPVIYSRPTPTRATHVVNPVDAVVINSRATSQNSRKRR